MSEAGRWPQADQAVRGCDERRLRETGGWKDGTPDRATPSLWPEDVHFFAFGQGSSRNGDPLAAGAEVSPGLSVEGDLRMPTTLDTR